MAGPRTVQLGQFTEEHAHEIAKRLEQAGIVWWHKESGRLSQVLFAGNWGVRIFVDADRLEEAQALASDVTSS